MKLLPFILLACLGCERIETDIPSDIPPIDTTIVAPVDITLACKRYGTGTFYVSAFTGWDIKVIVAERDTVDIPNGSTVRFDDVPAGWFSMYEQDKYSYPYWNLFFVHIDTCQSIRAIFEQNVVKKLTLKIQNI